MRKRMITLGIVAALTVLVAFPVAAASRGTTFTPLGLFPLCGTVPEGEFCEDFPLTTVVDMSGDGKTVVGMHAFFSGNYIWTAETGLNTIGPVAGAPWIARDGSEIASTPIVPPNFDFSQSAYWAGGFYPDQTWDLIPTPAGFSFCDSSGQSTFNISAGGEYVVGLTWIDFDANGNGCDGASAFISSGGITSVLENPVNDDSTRANAVNADGSVVVGWMQTNQREASKWIDGTQSFLCPDPIGAGGVQFCSEGWDVTPDGSLMLTSMAIIPDDFNARATIVDQAGNYEQLPFPDAPFDPQWDTFSARAMSDDGGAVIGSFGGGGFFGSPPYPVLWNRDLGMTIDVQVFLLGQGLDDLFFWVLSDGAAISSDGKVIGGQGVNPDGWIEAWIADISRVKVCHKPDGDSNGARRTLTIGWEGVADHLGHGDILSTCEFALADGHSRAMQGREAMVGRGNDDPTRDARVGTIDDVRRSQSRAGQSAFGSVSVTSPYPTTPAQAGAFGEIGTAEGGQSPAQRELLRQRIERFRERR